MISARDRHWKPRNSPLLFITEMEDGHLRNAILMVQRKLDRKHYERQGSKVSPLEAREKLRELVAEALARQYLKDIIR